MLRAKASAADDKTQRTCHIVPSSWQISVMVHRLPIASRSVPM